jgi:hypothetical protein
MSRGGKRPGAGNKPKWKHGKTKVIRVPEVLAGEILEIAKEIDENGFFESETYSKVLDLSSLPVFTSHRGLSVSLVALLMAGYEIKPASLADRIITEAYKEQLR